MTTTPTWKHFMNTREGNGMNAGSSHGEIKKITETKGRGVFIYKRSRGTNLGKGAVSGLYIERRERGEVE